MYFGGIYFPWTSTRITGNTEILSKYVHVPLNVYVAILQLVNYVVL